MEDGVNEIFKERNILALQYPFKCTAYYTFQDKNNLYLGKPIFSS